MKKLLLLTLFFISITGYSQNIGIGTSAPNANAKLDIADTSRGLLIPRMDAAHRISIPNTKGLLVYDTTSNTFWYNNGSIWKNMDVAGGGGSGWQLTGNGGTTDGTNFIGTTDNVPLTLRVNNVQAGRIDSSKINTYLGYQSGKSNTTATTNTGMGFHSLFSDTTGSYNTAHGAYSLFSNGSGSFNTAAGVHSLFFNNSGIYNTANGFQAMFTDSSGNFNTATGAFGLFGNKIGSSNTASGFQSLFLDSSGSNNTANGGQSLFFNKTGSNNTSIGYQSLYQNTGDNNIALGANAGFNLTTGNSNIVIGNQGVAGEANTIRIGTAQTKAFLAGIFGATIPGGIPVLIDANGQMGTILSSAQFKQNIINMGSMSELLYKLRPVLFQYKKDVTPDRTIQYGLIAEEVEKIDPNLVAYDKDGKIFTVKYHLLTPLILNELQKEHEINVEQQKIINDQQKVNHSLQEQIDELKKLINK